MLGLAGVHRHAMRSQHPLVASPAKHVHACLTRLRFLPSAHPGPRLLSKSLRSQSLRNSSETIRWMTGSRRPEAYAAHSAAADANAASAWMHAHLMLIMTMICINLSIFTALVRSLLVVWWLTVWSLRWIPTAGQGGGGGGQAAAPRARGSKDGPPRPQARRSPAVRPGQSPGLHRCAPCCLPLACPLPERASDPDRLRIGL